MEPLTIAILSIAFLFFLVMIGIHIGVSLATASVIGIWAITGKPYVAVKILGTTAYSAVMDYIFAVIPLFVLMGLLATLSGATRDLFSAAQVFLGRTRGGIGIATVVANAVFASITGVSVASAAVFSKIAIPEMRRLNYDQKFGLGIVAGSAILGMLIPPSILMIVYGVLSEQSIGRLFVAGVMPGLLVTAILSAGIWTMVKLRPELGGIAKGTPRPGVREALAAIGKTWGVLALIGLILGGIYGGLFTPTEAGAIGAAGAFILVVAKRRLSWKEIWRILVETGHNTASIFLLLITAQMYSRMLALSGMSTAASTWAGSLPVPPIVIVLAFIGVFLLLGMVLDSTSILLLTIPIMLPIVTTLQLDPIWFGIVSIVAIEIGLLTPPFGMVVFAMKSSLGDEVRIEDIFAGSMPFMVMLFIALMILVAFPPIITWLPSLM